MVENITITKDIFVNVLVDAFPAGAAEAEVVKNQRNQYNEVEQFNPLADADITNSGNMSAGIINEGFYAVLVMLASVTSLAAGSWLEWIIRRGRPLR